MPILITFTVYLLHLALKLMYYNRVHAWWYTQSRLATLLSSSIAHRWVDCRLFDGSDLK